MPTKIILGPPGTGKTTTLLSMLEDRMTKGIRPGEVGFFSFTKKATIEAKERAVTKFNYEPNQLPYFQTLHSLAFRGAGLAHNQVIQLRHLQEIGAMLGVEVTRMNFSEEGGITFGMKKGDRMFHLENLYRVKKSIMQTEWNILNDDDINIWEMEKLCTVYKDYKKDYNLFDYTDMLEVFIRAGKLPRIKLLIIDEAQDLSRLQWELVKMMMRMAEEVIIAGDDDQAIYSWAGADIETFVQLAGEVRVLDQSYRVPRSVHALAEKIITMIQFRRPKTWKPKEDEGRVQYHQSFEEIDMSQGTWLLLARNNYMLESLEQHCRSMGYSYSTKKGAPLQDKAFHAIKMYQRVLHNKAVTSTQVKQIYDFMTAGVGYVRGSRAALERENPNRLWDINILKREGGLLTTGHWVDALDKVHEADRSYILSALKRGENLHSEPRIKVSTIHGVKGGEADHVLLMPDMSMRTFREYEKDREAEARVWYVGVTRARLSLHITAPGSIRSFEPLS